MPEKADISALLQRYQAALDEGDAGAAVGCFTADAIVAGAGFPTLNGHDLAGAYQQMFHGVRMNVTFEVEEIEVTGQTTGWARTTSHGTQTLLASGQVLPEANRELFILERENHEWKIARYLFSELPTASGPAST